MNTKTKDNRITFRLPIALAEEFDQVVDSKDACKSKVMRTLVADWLQKQRETADV